MRTLEQLKQVVFTSEEFKRYDDNGLIWDSIGDEVSGLMPDLTDAEEEHYGELIVATQERLLGLEKADKKERILWSFIDEDDTELNNEIATALEKAGLNHPFQ